MCCCWSRWRRPVRWPARRSIVLVGAGGQRAEHEVGGGVDRLADAAPALQRQRPELLTGDRVVGVRRAVGGGAAGAVEFGDGGGDEVAGCRGGPRRRW